jgi:YD repeat-containing protein
MSPDADPYRTEPPEDRPDTPADTDSRGSWDQSVDETNQDATPPPVAGTSPFPWTPPPSADWPRIDGYEITGELGRGGMGVVFRARQLRLKRDVALKMVQASRYGGEGHRQRFLREANSIARLQHPNIVQVFDLGEHDGQPYLAMELVTGGNLAEAMRRERITASESGSRTSRRSTVWNEAARLMATLARAVQFAHEQGIIHRDLKPGNVLLTQTGEPKITDFGLAKQVEADPTLTADGAILGTPGYMAPEQASGQTRRIGPASDIYSLGVILYELITGKRPFARESAYDEMQASIRDLPAVPSRVRPGIPRDLATIALKCLEKDIPRRYASAGELADDLERFLRGEPILARRTAWPVRMAMHVRRHPAQALTILIALLVACGVVAWGVHWYGYERPSVNYYRDAIAQNHAFSGVHPISLSAVQSRAMSWRITRRGAWGPVVRAEVINGSLAPHISPPKLTEIAPADEGSVIDARAIVRMDYQYNDADQVEAQLAYDRQGRLIWSFQNQSPEVGLYFDRNGVLGRRSASGAVRIEYEFHDGGYYKSFRYTDARGRPRASGDGSYGTRFALATDHVGRNASETNLGPDGQPAMHPDGYVQIRYQYDDNDELTEVSLWDQEGRRATHREGWSRRTILDRDAYGNLIRDQFLDRQGLPTIVSGGFASVQRTYDERGHLQDMIYYDADDKPTRVTDGYHRVHYGYDSLGRRTREQYFDPAGKAVLGSRGFAAVRYAYGEGDGLAGIDFLGTNDEPVTITDGYASIRARFNEDGRVVWQEVLGPDAKRTVSKAGYCEVRNVWNGDDMTETALFGIDGKPTTANDGFHRTRYEYDELGNTTVVAYYDTRGQLVEGPQWYARSQTKYDERGLIVEVQYFDAQRHPCLARGGYSIERFEHDRLGHVIQEAFFDNAGQPIVVPKGYHRTTIEVDSLGQVRRKSFFDVQGKPAWVTDGYASVEYDHDAQSVKIAERYYDFDGEPVEASDGYHRAVHETDARGNVWQSSYFDRTGAPAVSVSMGSHVLQTDYNDRDQIIRVKYMIVDALGQQHLLPYGPAIMEQTLDSLGRSTQLDFLDASQSLTLNPSVQAARLRATYDSRGNETTRSHFGVQDQPVLNNEGVHLVQNEYNSRGVLVASAYFDTHGKPIAGNRWRAARWQATANGRGQYEEQRWYDTQGKLTTRSIEGVAIVRSQYDPRGHEIDRRHFDENEEPISATGGVHRVRREYDARGSLVLEEYFDESDKPVLHPKYLGFRWTAEYDALGRLSVERWFDPREKPVICSEGYAVRKTTYDARGRVVGIEHLGKDGKLFSSPDRYHARQTREYDRKNRLTRVEYYSAENELMETEAVVTFVAPWGQAAALGLREGDILVSYNDEPVTSWLVFAADRQRMAPGDPPQELVVRRGEQTQTLLLPRGMLNADAEDRPVGKNKREDAPAVQASGV